MRRRTQKGFEFVSILGTILGSVRTTRKNSKKCPESITNNFRQLKFGAKPLEGFVLTTVSFGILVFGFWLNASSSLLYQGTEEEE